MAIKHVKVTPAQEGKLLAWIDQQINDIESRRVAREQNWVRWRQQYEGKTSPKNFPWKNSSNVHVPITAINTDAIHANMMNRLFGFERVWDVKAVNSGEVLGVDQKTNQPITWTDLADASANYLAFEAGPTGTMDAYDIVEQAIMEALKLGTGIVYQPWLTITKTEVVYDYETGGYERKGEKTLFDGIKPSLIPLEDFLISPGYAELEGPAGAPCFGHRYYLRYGQLMERAYSGWYRTKKEPVEVKGATGGVALDIVKNAQAQAEGEWNDITSLHQLDHQLYDLWVKFDINDDGIEESLYVTYHRQARRLLGIRPFIYKSSPYIVFRYLRREHRFYGIGVPEMLETLQAGINTSFNQAVDNATIANTRMWQVRRGSTAAQYLSDVYPGKKVLSDDMQDIKPLEMGEVFPSAFETGILFRDYAERRTGVSDYNLGRQSDIAGKGATATSTLALLQESSRRFDLYSKDIKKAVGEMGMKALELIQQFKPTGRIFSVMGAKDGQMVTQALTLPSDVDLREHLFVTTTASVTSGNKEVAKQNALSAYAIMTQYFDRVYQLGLMMSNPATPPPMRDLADSMGEAAERMMRRLLDAFDLQDAAAFLPQLDDVYAQARLTPPMPAAGMGVPGGVPPGVPGGMPGGPPQPGGIPPGIGGAGGVPTGPANLGLAGPPGPGGLGPVGGRGRPRG